MSIGKSVATDFDWTSCCVSRWSGDVSKGLDCTSFSSWLLEISLFSIDFLDCVFSVNELLDDGTGTVCSCWIGCKRNVWISWS